MELPQTLISEINTAMHHGDQMQMMELVKMMQDAIISGYSDWMVDLSGKGFNPYLLSFLFLPMAGSERSKMEQMCREVIRVYAKSLTRVIRRPGSSSLDQLPVWIVCPDFPVWKHKKLGLREPETNDGLHMHAIAMIPPLNRLKVGFQRSIRDNQRVYAKRPLIKVAAEFVDRDIGYVTSYALKSIAKRRATVDSITVLPRTWSEMPRIYGRLS